MTKPRGIKYGLGVAYYTPGSTTVLWDTALSFFGRGWLCFLGSIRERVSSLGSGLSVCVCLDLSG